MLLIQLQSYINDTLISVSKFKKNLRDFPGDNLSFKTHIFSVVKKSRQISNSLLLYAFYELNNSIVISLCEVYIRSLLDYAAIINSPSHNYIFN